MKYLKLFEAYGDYIDSGRFNKVSDIDDEWILKYPLLANDSALRDKTNKNRLAEFKRHILYMSKFPDFFAETKLLSKTRAAQRKVNIKAAKREINYLLEIIKDKFDYWGLGSDKLIIDLYFYKGKYLNMLNYLDEYAKENNDEIAQKWYDFIVKLREKFNPIKLDIVSNNIGLDKEGNIKLIDF